MDSLVEFLLGSIGICELIAGCYVIYFTPFKLTAALAASFARADMFLALGLLLSSPIARLLTATAFIGTLALCWRAGAAFLPSVIFATAISVVAIYLIRSFGFQEPDRSSAAAEPSQTSEGSLRDNAKSLSQSESLAHHLESETPSNRQAPSICHITSSAMNSLSIVGNKPTVGVDGETEVLYSPSQPLTLTWVISLVLILVLFWYQHLRLGRRRSDHRRYPYQLLNAEKNEIRLLHILPSIHKDDPVSCNLRHVSFVENPPYVALSYNWGDQNDRRFIQLNGVTVSVTVSLEEALRHMRPQWKALEVWVDALCIDQHNKEERGAQVLRMFGIYQRARVVAIWIGPEANGSEKVMNVLSKSQGLERSIDYGDRFLKPLADYELTPSVENWHYFFARPYWQRVWIIQEIAASNQRCLLCGDWTVELRDIDKFLAALVKAQTHSVEDSAALIHFIFELCSGRRDLDREPLRLLEVLQQTSHSMSSEILDKVYGILGLVSDRATFVPEPNYSYSKRELCMTMTDTAMSRKRHLDFIFLGKSRLRASGLPTWCAEYTASASESFDAIMAKYLLGQDFRYRAGLRRNRWNTTGDSRAMAMIDHPKGILYFKGFRIGTVTSSRRLEHRIPEPDLIRDRPHVVTPASYKLILDSLLQILLIYIALPEVTRDTAQLLAYLLEYGPASTVVRKWFDTNSHFDVHGLPLTELLKGDSRGTARELANSLSKELAAALLNSLESVIEEQLCLITLEMPNVGWAHPDTEYGDHVFIAHGCSLPIVLRPVAGQPNHFALIGRAYVSNAMNNEYKDRVAESAQLIGVC